MVEDSALHKEEPGWKQRAVGPPLSIQRNVKLSNANDIAHSIWLCHMAHAKYKVKAHRVGFNKHLM